MSEQAVRAFEYRGLTIEVMPGVFEPNRTTELLLDAALNHSLEGKSALDLGCGSGVVGVCAKKFGGVTSMCGSDISETAVANACHNAARLGLDVDFRSGSLFEPWRNRKFDAILNDVSGVAEPIARLSPWYPPEIFCDAGEDGTTQTMRVIAAARDHLLPRGVLFFPTVSLSNEVRILEVARSTFPHVECVLMKRWPFKDDFWRKMMSNATCRRLIDEGIVQVFRRGSRHLWGTSIYMASLAP